MPAPQDYVDVAERIRLFYVAFPQGSLQMWSQPELMHVGDKTYIRYIAAAYRNPDDKMPGIGCAWEPVPGPTPFTRDSELMNAETSAWGRAIVALGFETKHVASADEVRNRQQFVAPNTSATATGASVQYDATVPEKPQERPPAAANKQVTPGQLTQIATTLKLLEKAFPEHPGEGRTWADVAKEHVEGRSADRLSMAEANELNDWLEGQFLEAQKAAEVPFG